MLTKTTMSLDFSVAIHVELVLCLKQSHWDIPKTKKYSQLYKNLMAIACIFLDNANWSHWDILKTLKRYSQLYKNLVYIACIFLDNSNWSHWDIPKTKKYSQLYKNLMYIACIFLDNAYWSNWDIPKTKKLSIIQGLDALWLVRPRINNCGRKHQSIKVRLMDNKIRSKGWPCVDRACTHATTCFQHWEYLPFFMHASLC